MTKKARGGRIKKENSISSVELDSRSSNFVFSQVANSVTSNGRANGRSGNYDEDDSDDARDGGSLNYVSQTTFSKNEAEYENVSHDDLAGNDSWAVKEEKIDEHVGLGSIDPLVESIIPLHLTQEALEREVEKLGDVGKEDILSSNDWVQSQPPVSVTKPAPMIEEEDAKKLKNMAWRYVFCLIIQSALLLLVLYIVVLKFSSEKGGGYTHLI
ncbi:putative WPP domain-interacting protein/3 [Helianthus annuus]|nr:hypothetical protein HanIR_Chr17g0890121 [Helianthus annuus]KAJ0637433.1 putative WPP domain-interacting protein/3 [Helianthus annuus]